MRTAISQQLNLFWIAVSFFTRLPVPRSLDYSQFNLNRASRYFSAVGWIIGGLSALMYLMTAQWLPQPVALLITMGFGFLLTGGFHEDGLADTADGLGGGWTVEQKLSITKDSRLGSYGTLAIWFALTLKFTALNQLDDQIIIALLVAHPLSRMMATLVIRFLPYVSDTNTAKSKPLAEQLSLRDFSVNLMVGCLALIGIIPVAFFAMLAMLLVTTVFALFLKRQLGGFTGDTLGALQQLNELTLYCVLLSSGAAL